MPTFPLRAALAGALVLAAATACARTDPPSHAAPPDAAATAPDSFLVRFETSKGPFVLLARRAWAPVGVDRLHQLVRDGFYDGARFFRVVPGFVAQFGLPADPRVAADWYDRKLPDDTVRASNRRGTVAFARGGPASRSTQLFVNLRDNARLDTLGGFGFPPIGEIVEGMAVVDSLYGGYGDGGRGAGPVQDSIRLQGNSYLDRRFPQLDSIVSARIVTEWNVR